MLLIKHKLFYFLITTSCLISLLFYLNQNQSNNHNMTNIGKRLFRRLYSQSLYDSYLNQGCYSEWVLLNNDVYFRRNLAFYYTDTNKVKLYINKRKSNKNLTFRLDVNLEMNDATLANYVLTDLIYTKLDEKESYCFMSIEANLKLENKLNLNDIYSLNVFVSDENRLKTKVPINLIIKEFNRDVTFKKHSIVCSKLYYVKREQASQFKWWIEMNKLHGYDKVVIYNNSIENSNEFNDLFDEYRDFVQLIPFQCIPNFIDVNNTNKPFINSFLDIKYNYKKNEVPLHVHYETFVFTECLLTNKDKYQYVTINDQDETVVPLYLNIYRKIEPNLISNRNDYLKEAESKCYYGDSSNNNIESYLKKLSNNLNFLNNVTYHFHTAIYMKNKTINIVFKQLENLFKNISNETITYPLSVRIIEKDEINNRGGQMLNFTIIIQNENELNYAKYLNGLYVTFMKPFILKNEFDLKKIYEPFSRFFYLLGRSTTWFCGKTIHNTFLSNGATTHYPFNLNGMKSIPIEHGYVSHFRNGYNIYWDNKSIMDFQFDLNYFLCYFKPIVKKFKFQIDFDV